MVSYQDGGAMGANRAAMLALLDKVRAACLCQMKSPDSDYRYMALNDLSSSIAHEAYTYHPLDETVERTAVKEVFALLTDKNDEVKNLAVKTYVALLTQPRHAVPPRTEWQCPLDPCPACGAAV